MTCCIGRCAPRWAVGNGDIWLMSTPNGKTGFFHEEWTHGGDQWVRIRVTAPDCPRIDPAFLAEEKAASRRRDVPAGVSM